MADKEYIERGKLIEDLKILAKAQEPYKRSTILGVIVTISQRRAADVVEVRHGEWKQTCVPDVFQCTSCKRPTKMDELCDSETLREYCPNCGAKMDGERKEQT